MADYPFLLGAAFLNQAARGTATAMAAIGTSIDNVTDGAVLGDPNSGSGGSGVALALAKNLSEKAVVTGSFTRDFANRIGTNVDSFQMGIELKGNGAAAPAADADYTPDVGIVALLRAAGFTGSAIAGAENGWRFIPGATDLITAAVYQGLTGAAGGAQAIIRDVEASGLTLGFTPGAVATAIFDLTGIFDSVVSGTHLANPFVYGQQGSLSAPSVESAGFTWGPSTPAARSLGFESLAIAINNGGESIQASNVAGGLAPRQTDRVITVTAKVDATDAELLYEFDQLAEDDIANADPLTFTIGTPGEANAIRVTLPTPELVSLQASDPMGNSQAFDAEWIARATTANGEMQLDFI